MLVGSSDLSHFYSKYKADILDTKVIEKYINDFNSEELQKDLETKKCEACGGGAIVALLKSLKLIKFFKIKSCCSQ